MRWTNEHDLPDRVIRVLVGKRKPYTPRMDRLSVTDAIDEPLPRILFTNHWDDIVRDYSDLITMVQGTALHSRYELCADDDEEAEVKLEEKFDDITLVGKADSIFDDTILDVKQTGVYGEKYRLDKWTKQLNMYAWMWGKRGRDVKKLVVDIWYRDWKIKNTSWRDYPPIPYRLLELPLWTPEEQLEYVKDRVEVHLAYEVHDNVADYRNKCSVKQRGIRYECYKNKNKTPSKVGDTITEMQDWIDAEEKKGTKVTVRSSEPVFCMRYCKARSVCPFVKSGR